MGDVDEDVPTLSINAIKALEEFYKEQEDREKVLANNGTDEVPDDIYNCDLSKYFEEDWQMSQFWYDSVTSNKLAQLVIELCGRNTDAKVACLSCPSIFRACGEAKNIHLFEFDKRFSLFGSSYFYYDYNVPGAIPEGAQNSYNLIIADPPFLSEECLEKVSQTVLLLSAPNAKIILCTGEVMEKKANELLSLKKTSFVPRHEKNLGNDFACFSNFNFDLV